MKKVVWISRHEMTQDQKADLEDLLKTDIVVEKINHTWEASQSYWDDLTKNEGFLHGLFFEDGEIFRPNVVVAGVFPPVALEALHQIRHAYPSLEAFLSFFTPVSVQAVEERADGDRKIAFRHARWSEIY